MSAEVVAFTGLFVVVTAWARPFDVVVIESSVVVAVLAAATGCALVVAAVTSRAATAMRLLLGFAGVAFTVAGGMAFAVTSFISSFTDEEVVHEAPVEDTTLTVALVHVGGSTGGSVVRLEGRLGPFRRERTVVDPRFPCPLQLEPDGPRRFRVGIFGGVSDCPMEVWQTWTTFEVEDDGWTTRVVDTG